MQVIADDKESYQRVFAVAAVWGLGGLLEAESAERFSEWWRAHWQHNPVMSNAAAFPADGSVFDYYVEAAATDSGSAVSYATWSQLADTAAAATAAAIPADGILWVPHAASARAAYFADLLVQNGYPLLAVGPAGSGKTGLLQGVLRTLPDNQFAWAGVHVHYYTSAAFLQVCKCTAPATRQTHRLHRPLFSVSI